MKKKSQKSKKVTDALSRRHLLLKEMQIEMAGFKELKNLYPKDPDFAKAWKSCIVPITLDKTKWLDFIIQDGMLFN